ncbi:hypothetical protein CHLRE_07g314676v5 [Chlamydomonas reinhardtii]|uniref:Uncharacterized protein n=1 Tax=Chlamydomonas reinhardtii TaxID=3055 RepID=A0A2K3DIL1_CHLRE|nr:uncharacterized protein CHLRE_07g314676v5 [Chlamydomonas reinhardtii]PNW80369.1 hypothetical protein CHLRE_07g314676v5 [Chlamydomonas reinhardtii]
MAPEFSSTPQLRSDVCACVSKPPPPAGPELAPITRSRQAASPPGETSPLVVTLSDAAVQALARHVTQSTRRRPAGRKQRRGAAARRRWAQTASPCWPHLPCSAVGWF